jgi:hypothetical protein
MACFGWKFAQHSKRVQLFEGTLQIAAAQIGDEILVSLSLLPPDFGQFRRLETGVIFQNPQGIAALDGPMLGGVAGENDAGNFPVQPDQPPAPECERSIVRPRQSRSPDREPAFAGLEFCSSISTVSALANPASDRRTPRAASADGANVKTLNPVDSIAATASFIIVVLPVPAPPRTAMTRSLLCKNMQHRIALFVESSLFWKLYDIAERLEFSPAILDKFNQPLFL